MGTLNENRYDPSPAFRLEPGLIECGWDDLAEALARHRTVTLDGYGGTLWEEVRSSLASAFSRRGVKVFWRNVEEALRPRGQIEALLAPHLGGDDPLFGTRFGGSLADFFDPERLASLRPDREAQLSVIYGCGAALADWPGSLTYFDIPKNLIQYRSRAGAVTNLGAARATGPKEAYKRFYFVDWPALNRHKARLTPAIDLLVDGRLEDGPTFIGGGDLRRTLELMGRSYARAVPWFEPGPWGGQWLREQIPQLPQDVPNYAWSFELITPENGLALESDGQRLEFSFDFLMFHAGKEVLGDHFERFGHDFPIRFDYLDTMGGGNLSLQCHPGPDYIREHFGEAFTQDETYYIVDHDESARVYLGFREGVEEGAFRESLEEGLRSGRQVEVERFVHTLPSVKHALYLIPNRTIHCSGAGNLVLEISATPYIFTFKMYDWQRLDLEGRPRPLNIARAFENLEFTRAGNRVAEELVARPEVVERGGDWQVIHLPTHPEHFYDVQRLEFCGAIEVETKGTPHVLNLVEGGPILLESPAGPSQRFHFAETFLVPAAAGSYRLRNEGQGQARVVKAYLKDRRPAYGDSLEDDE